MFKKFACLLVVLSLTVLATSAFAKEAPKTSDQLPKYEYKLLDTTQVKGRQGITTDGEFYYVSASKALFKYDKNWNLVASNTNPFEGYPLPSNHFGDIDVYNGEIYTGAENFVDGVGKDIQIAVHDAKTLKLKRTFNFEPASGQLEVSGITVDPVKRSVWMCSWVGEESGRYLYEYSLDTGKFLRKVHLKPAPQYVQGIYYYKGAIYMTADDGIADDESPDTLYRADITDLPYAYVNKERSFDDVKREGEIEGLNVDPKTGDMLVLFNRGSRIVLGMVKGFYPGYDHEISEVYRYQMTPAQR